MRSLRKYRRKVRGYLWDRFKNSIGGRFIIGRVRGSVVGRIVGRVRARFGKGLPVLLLLLAIASTASADTVERDSPDWVWGSGEMWTDQGTSRRFEAQAGETGTIHVYVRRGNAEVSDVTASLVVGGTPLGAGASYYAYRLDAVGSPTDYLGAYSLPVAGGPLETFTPGPGGVYYYFYGLPDFCEVARLDYAATLIPQPPAAPELFSVDGQPFPDPNFQGNYTHPLVLDVVMRNSSLEYYYFDLDNITPGDPWPSGVLNVTPGDHLIAIICRVPDGPWSNYSTYELHVAGGDPLPPAVSPQGGTVADGTITITHDDNGAMMEYAVDPVDPENITWSAVAGDGLLVLGNYGSHSVYFRAFVGGQYSGVVSYSFNYPAPDAPEPPSVSPASGTYENAVLVTITAPEGSRAVYGFPEQAGISNTDENETTVNLTADAVLYVWSRDMVTGVESDPEFYTYNVEPSISFNPPAGPYFPNQFPTQVTVTIGTGGNYRAISTPINVSAYPDDNETIRNSGTVMYLTNGPRLAVEAVDANGETIAYTSGVYTVNTGNADWWVEGDPDPSVPIVLAPGEQVILKAVIMGTPPFALTAMQRHSAGSWIPVQSFDGTIGALDTMSNPEPGIGQQYDHSYSLQMMPPSEGQSRATNSAGVGGFELSWHITYQSTTIPPNPCTPDPDNLGVRKCPDTDGDGIPNVVEEYWQETYSPSYFDPQGVFPKSIDEDYDNIPDRWEYQWFLCSNAVPCHCTKAEFGAAYEAAFPGKNPREILTDSRRKYDDYDQDDDGELDSGVAACTANANTGHCCNCCCYACTTVNWGSAIAKQITKPARPAALTRPADPSLDLRQGTLPSKVQEWLTWTNEFGEQTPFEFYWDFSSLPYFPWFYRWSSTNYDNTSYTYFAPIITFIRVTFRSLCQCYFGWTFLSSAIAWLKWVIE